MDKKIGLIVTFIFFSLSFITLKALPSYIINDSYYATLTYVIWAIGFSFAFIYFGLQK